MEKYKISVACILMHNGKFLMVKEEQNGKISWDIPAGGIELHETLEQAVIREVEEETGLRIDSPQLKEVLLFQEKQRTTANFLYYIDMVSSDQNISKPFDADIIQTEWFSKEKIQRLLDSDQYEHAMAKKRLIYILEGFSKSLEVINI